MTEIKVYSTPICPWCSKLKNYLKDKKISFKDIDVTADQNEAEKMLAKSGQLGVPQTEINGKMIVGFDQEAIDAELAKLKK